MQRVGSPSRQVPPFKHGFSRQKSAVTSKLIMNDFIKCNVGSNLQENKNIKPNILNQTFKEPDLLKVLDLSGE